MEPNCEIRDFSIDVSPSSPNTVLDTLIDEAAQVFRDYYGIDEFGDPGVQSQVSYIFTFLDIRLSRALMLISAFFPRLQEEILAVGRLCAESDTAKMTETASYLESSRSLGSGHRVLLKFEPDCKVRYAPHGGGGIGLFPGSMVGLKGINGGGKLFAVKEILMVS